MSMNPVSGLTHPEKYLLNPDLNLKDGIFNGDTKTLTSKLILYYVQCSHTEPSFFWLEPNFLKPIRGYRRKPKGFSKTLIHHKRRCLCSIAALYNVLNTTTVFLLIIFCFLLIPILSTVHVGKKNFLSSSFSLYLSCGSVVDREALAGLNVVLCCLHYRFQIHIFLLSLNSLSPSLIV